MTNQKIASSYFGDIAVDIDKAKSHFTLFPRKDALTGKWIWFKMCMKAEHIVLKPTANRILPIRQIYYFKNESWLQVLLS